MGRGRWLLMGFGLGALTLIASPVVVVWFLAPTLCPTVVVRESRIGGGVVWQTSRSTCDEGRIVWQMRVAPPQGVLRLAYDAEGGPEPVGLEQLGRLLTVELAQPLANGAAAVQVELDHRARPVEAVRIRDGRVVR